MSQNQDSKDIASKLGLSQSSSSNESEQLAHIASQIGFDNYTYNDENNAELNKRLKQMLHERNQNQNNDDGTQNDSQNSEENNFEDKGRFGEKEYNQARDKNGRFDKKYYAKKGDELDRKAESARSERNKDKKEVQKKDKDGNITTQAKKKNIFDKAKDDVNLLKANKDRFDNKINNAKANMYRASHPGEALKDDIEGAVKEKTKEVAKAAGDKAKQAGKAVAKKAGQAVAAGAKAAGSAIVSFIAANPWILAVIAFIVLFIIILFTILGDSSNNAVNSFNKECDFNLTTVNMTYCGGSTKEMSLDDYVVNTAYKIVGGRNLSDDGIEALMIIIKTNALANGNYNNKSKKVTIDDCNINDLYTTSSVISNSGLFWWPVGSVETEDIDGITFATGEPGSIKITSHFGSRNTGIAGASTNHKGLDIGNGGMGAGYHNVIASLSGVVTKVDNACKGARGCYIRVDHGTYETIYQHLHPGTITVDEGDTVYQGQVLAKMGQSGVGSGAHLHFEILINGTNVDPENYLDSSVPRPVEEDSLVEIAEEATLSITKVKELYDNISNEIYLSNTYYNTITNLDSNNALEINEDILGRIEAIGAENTYKIILDILYNDTDSETDTDSLENENIYQIYNLKGNCEFIVDGSGAAFSDVCDSISLTSTTFSRSEFIDKLTTYYSGRTKSWEQTFLNNAGTIYDVSVNNNINPELIVIRAILEGYSPVSYGYNYNNYWGYRCYNGQPLSSCMNFSSFSEGVLGYSGTLKNYNVESLLDVYYVKHYAYIGDYWYNPGNAGKGGCYYYPYIKKYMSEERSAAVGVACASGNTCSDSNCLHTNDEDQLAYSKFQIESSLRERKNVFGIDSENCGSYSEDCKLFAQGYEDWGKVSLGNSKLTMADSGCAVTSLAMGILCSGTKITVKDFNPGKFINALNDGECFTDDGRIKWGCSAITKIAPRIAFSNMYSDIGNYSDSDKKDIINSYSSNEAIILLRFVNDNHKRGHYVAYSGISGSNFVTKDPSGGKVTNVSISEVDEIVVYKISEVVSE